METKLSTVVPVTSTSRLDAIHEALLALAKTGLTQRGIAQHEVLMRLEIAVAVASDYGRRQVRADSVATTVQRLIRQSALKMSPDEPSVTDRGAAVLALLGMIEGSANDSQGDRRIRCAEHLGIKPATLSQPRKGTSHERRLLEELAERLSDCEEDYLAEQTRLRIRAQRTPYDSGLRVDWVRRFEAYYKLWTPADALHADLEKALPGGLRAGDEDLVVNALFYLAHFVHELETFVQGHGGLWVLASRKREQEVADLTYEIGAATGLTDREQSALRRHFIQHSLLIDFVEDLTPVQEIVEQWKSMVAACQCDATPEPENCRAHKVWTLTERFVQALDDEWDALVDWYDEERPTPLDQARM